MSDDRFEIDPEVRDIQEIEKISKNDSTDPYSVPKASLISDDPDSPDSFTDPQKRPASRGASWIFEAFGMYGRRPLIWMMTTGLYGIINILGLIPFVGAIVMYLLNPVFMGGFFIGAKQLEDEDQLSPGCLFYGFKQNGGQLVLLGLVLLGTMIVIGIIMFAMFFMTIGMNVTDIEHRMANFGLGMVLIFLVMLLITIPIVMAYYFAPILIAINQKPIFEAIALSFRACIRNIWSFLINGLILFVIFIIVGFIMSICMGAVAPRIVNNPGIATFLLPFIIMIVFMILVGPLLMLNVYTAYRDIFYKK